MEAGVFLVYLAIAAIPAIIAKGKGRSFGLWFLFSVFCFLIALVASLVIEARGPCRHCGAQVRDSASFCDACGEQLAPRRLPTHGVGLSNFDDWRSP